MTNWRRNYNWLLRHTYAYRGGKTALAVVLGVTMQALNHWDNYKCVPNHERQLRLAQLRKEAE